MKHLSWLFLLLVGIVTFSCNDSRKWKDYDKGYEAAWEGEEMPNSFWTSKKEKEGYKNGLDDAWTYDTGYDDGYEGKGPQYLNDPLYMKAYKDGKKDKKRRW